MNLKQALATGRPFRRPGRYAGSGLACGSEYFNGDRSKYSSNCMIFTLEDVLSDEWEIKEPEVTVTASALARAWSDSTKEFESEYFQAYQGTRTTHGASEIFKRMLRKLGL